MTLRGVILDLFHTLVDPEEFRPRDFDRAGRMAEILGVEAGAFRRFWDRELLDLLVSPDDPAERAAAYARAQGVEVSRGRVAAAGEALGGYQDRSLERPVSGAVEALAALGAAGLRRGLLSNAHARDVGAWERSPLASCFEAVVFSCFAGVAKPDPGAYATVLEALGVAGEEALFVADGGGGELAGARRFGFAGVVLVAGPALRSGVRTAPEVTALESQADLRIEDVAELPDLLARHDPFGRG